MSRWTAAAMPDQTGRTVVVTGANSGIGRAAAAAFAAAGAHVVLAVRNRERGEAAAREIGGRTRSAPAWGSVEVQLLDLAELASVRAFADHYRGPVDVLVNNAGLMAVPRGQTADGFELQIGTNHLGHFALTNLLLPRITDRVVTVSSLAHRTARLDLDDLQWQRRRYSPFGAYGASKLANLLFTLELQRRLQHAGSPVRTMAAHPGAADTRLAGHLGNVWAERVALLLTKTLAQSAAAGARPTLYAATQDLPGASYVGPDRLNESRGHPTLVGRSAAASDLVLAADLWRASEELTGVRYPAAASR